MNWWDIPELIQLIPLLVLVGLTAFIIAYLIYWYFFDERPDTIRM
jgi:phage shock protein PspC (stress-responsive transcriptional regulator)